MNRSALRFMIIFILLPQPSFSQSNDQEAIRYVQHRLETIKAILRTSPQNASNACVEALKKIIDNKNKPLTTAQSLFNQDIKFTILRALTDNALLLCSVDAQTICSHQHSNEIHKSCEEIINEVQ
ncbi:hypothetical protein COMNV_01298 [Commensalibacter sp. Nvir]|uniref:hypothetical protein n=1 Tax=Commensalibacter sp. Nvir TaxID=3069817 RepID=UPI002D303187|nr:hypothetical protein COMNV_01298 [Commensalibacter sp. Nvir]